MSQPESEHSASNPSVCPYCGVQQEFEESVSHGQRDNGDLEFVWDCDKCNNHFTTVKELNFEPPENHTFMWAQDEETEEVQQFIHLHGGEENTGVKAKRADMNMRSGNNYEVHGRDWAIERLFELFSDQFDLPEESEGPLEIPWLDEPDEQN